MYIQYFVLQIASRDDDHDSHVASRDDVIEVVLVGKAQHDFRIECLQESVDFFAPTKNVLLRYIQHSN